MGFFESFTKFFVDSNGKEDININSDNIIVPKAMENDNNNSELIAVLTAAIMASYGSQTNCNLKVTSFKRINNSSPAWNIAGRNDNLNSSL